MNLVVLKVELGANEEMVVLVTGVKKFTIGWLVDDDFTVDSLKLYIAP